MIFCNPVELRVFVYAESFMQNVLAAIFCMT